MAQRGNIAEFTSPTDSLDTSKGGQAAQELAASGWTEGKLYRQAGDDIKQGANNLGAAVEQHQYMTEVSQGAAASAALFNNKTAAWNQIASQPGAGNDPELQKKFMDDNLEPDLQKFQNGFTTEKGQMWALGQADQMRSEFYHRTSADVSNLAGEARMQDAKTTLNQYGAAVQRDPSSADHAMTAFGSYVDEMRSAMGSNLTPEMSSKFDAMKHDGANELAKVQVMSLAGNINDPQGPAKAKALLESGVHDSNITPPEQEQLQKFIQEQVRERKNQAAIDYMQQERAQKMQAEKITTDLFNKSYDADSGTFTFSKENMAAIMSNPSLPAETKLNIEGAVKKIASEATADDPNVIRSFAGRLESNSTSPLTQDDLLKQMADGKMTPATYNFFNERIQNKPDTKAENEMITQSLDEVKNDILKPVFGQPNTPSAERAYTRFQTWFLPAYQQALKDPSMQGMTNAQKAQTLLNPDSPKYMLGLETMKKFMAVGNDLIPGMVSPGEPLPSGTSRKPLDEIFGKKQ